MQPIDYSGYWTGRIEGTNHGGIALDLRQLGAEVRGIAKLGEPELGEYEYLVQGLVGDELSLKMTPGTHSNRANLALGNVEAVGTLDADGVLVGRWKSNVGTEGIFRLNKFEVKKLGPDLPKNNSVFLVHGHDEGAKHAVARFIEQLGIQPVILQEQINKGMTVIEKFEDFAARAGFAVVLMTPDDVGYAMGKEEGKSHRPRQNVILELGYFAAYLGRNKTFVLVKGDIEMPSDIFGLVYEQMDKSEGWKMRLARELKATGFAVDLNRAIS